MFHLKFSHIWPVSDARLLTWGVSLPFVYMLMIVNFYSTDVLRSCDRSSLMCFVYLPHYQVRKQRWERFSHSLARGMHDHLLSHVWLFVILWILASQAPYSWDFPGKKWVVISFSRGSSWPRDWTHISCVSCIGRWILNHWATREAPSKSQGWDLKPGVSGSHCSLGSFNEWSHWVLLFPDVRAAAALGHQPGALAGSPCSWSGPWPGCQTQPQSRLSWTVSGCPCSPLCFPLSWHHFDVQFSSVQFSRSIVSDSLQPSGLQHARLPCPSPTPGAYSNSCS